MVKKETNHFDDVSAFATRKAVQEPVKPTEGAQYLLPEHPSADLREEFDLAQIQANIKLQTTCIKKRSVDKRVTRSKALSDCRSKYGSRPETHTWESLGDAENIGISINDSETEDSEFLVEENRANHCSNESGLFCPTNLPENLSTFVPSKDNVLSDINAEWTVRLVENDTITVVGQYDLWVRRGAISVLGAVLHASSNIHRIYAPSTHSLPCIRHSHNPYGPEHQPAEITLFSCSTRIRLLQKLSSKFGRIWNHWNTQAQNSECPTYGSLRSFSLITSSKEDPYRRPLVVVQPFLDWQNLLSKLTNANSTGPQKIMICGPKSSGKSTFARLLTNTILSRAAAFSGTNQANRNHGIAFLDLDVGQPEFSPPGELSLAHLRSCIFGPPFTHPMVPPIADSHVIKAHHVGANTPRDDPRSYVRCAMDLLVHYRRMLYSYSPCPLIVNCSGWIQGSGLGVLKELFQGVAPTEVVYMSTAGPREVVEALVEASSKVDSSFHTLTSQPLEYVTRTSADLRTMQTLSYFHLDGSEQGNFRWNASPINTFSTIDLHYAGPEQCIFGIIVMGEQQDLNLLSDLLDGSIVGVVAIEDTSVLDLDGLSHSVAFENNIGGSGQAFAESLPCVGTWKSHPVREVSTDQNILSSARPRSEHGSIYRTPESLPYLFMGTGTCTPLDPTTSRSFGQAIVHCIDKESKILRLITPISQIVFDECRRTDIKIVLVRGKMDIPTWAYQEECVAAIAAHKQKLGRVQSHGDQSGQSDIEHTEAFNIEAWARGRPWIRVDNGRSGKQRKDKIWKVRRNLKSRDSGADEALGN